MYILKVPNLRGAESSFETSDPFFRHDPDSQTYWTTVYSTIDMINMVCLHLAPEAISLIFLARGKLANFLF